MHAQSADIKDMPLNARRRRPRAKVFVMPLGVMPAPSVCSLTRSRIEKLSNPRPQMVSAAIRQNASFGQDGSKTLSRNFVCVLVNVACIKRNGRPHWLRASDFRNVILSSSSSPVQAGVRHALSFGAYDVPSAFQFESMSRCGLWSTFHRMSWSSEAANGSRIFSDSTWSSSKTRFARP